MLYFYSQSGQGAKWSIALKRIGAAIHVPTVLVQTPLYD